MVFDSLFHQMLSHTYFTIRRSKYFSHRSVYKLYRQVIFKQIRSKMANLDINLGKVGQRSQKLRAKIQGKLKEI